MDRIVLELRAKYERKITEMLLELKEADFTNLLDTAGMIAGKNGLTEDKLNQLLSEEGRLPRPERQQIP